MLAEHLENGNKSHINDSLSYFPWISTIHLDHMINK